MTVSYLDTSEGGVYMNKAKLKSIMALYGDTSKELAKALGITEQSVSSKMNENGSEFKQGEITKIKNRYKLSPADVDVIFFS
jgi:DNA-binding XRE family transcriptional regulator